MTDVNLAPQAMANVRIASVTAEKDEAQTSAAGRIEELGRQLEGAKARVSALEADLQSVAAECASARSLLQVGNSRVAAR